MSYNREEFQSRVGEGLKKRQAEMMPLYRAVQAVGVVMEQLTTGNPGWDRYLALLQGLVDRTRAAAATASAKLSDPAVWDPAQMAKCKSDLLEANTMIRTLELAMTLPKAIIENREQCDQIIADFEKGKDESATAQP